MKSNFVISLFCVFVCQSIFAASVPHELQLPETWYRLPEDSPRSSMEDRDLEPLPQETVEGIDRILGVHAGAWDRLTETRRAERKSPWKLRFLAMDLGLSMQGALGVLFLKGAGLMNLYWKKNETPTVATNTETPREDSNADLVFSDWVEPEILKVKLEPIVKAVLATGRVKNEKLFRKQLWDHASQFDILSHVLAMEPGRDWIPSRLRLDLTVEGSGMVMPTLSVGGGVKIRFDWFPTANVAKSTTNLRGRSAEMSHNFEKFVQRLMHEVQQASFDPTSTPAKLPLSSLVMTLAISANAKFGIATAGATLAGNLYLRRRTASDPPVPLSAPVIDEEPLQVIGGAPSRNQLEYASLHNIGVTREQRGEIVSTRYDLPEKIFQKGLDKALKMSTQFAERALRKQGKHWSVNTLRVQFALSIGGTVAVVTVSGMGALQLVFQST